MGLDIQGEQPESRRQEFDAFVELVTPVGQGQVQQHRRRRNGKQGGRAQLRRGISVHIGEHAARLSQRISGFLDHTRGQVGVGIKKAGGEPQLRVRSGQVQLGQPGRLLGLPAEIEILAAGDVPDVGISDPFDILQAPPRREGRAEQWHQRRTRTGALSSLRRGFVRGTLLYVGDSPCATEFPGSRNQSGGTALPDQLLGAVPSPGRLPYCYVFHLRVCLHPGPILFIICLFSGGFNHQNKTFFGTKQDLFRHMGRGSHSL